MRSAEELKAALSYSEEEAWRPHGASPLIVQEAAESTEAALSAVRLQADATVRAGRVSKGTAGAAQSRGGCRLDPRVGLTVGAVRSELAAAGIRAGAAVVAVAVVDVVVAAAV